MHCQTCSAPCSQMHCQTCSASCSQTHCQTCSAPCSQTHCQTCSASCSQTHCQTCSAPCSQTHCQTCCASCSQTHCQTCSASCSQTHCQTCSASCSQTHCQTCSARYDALVPLPVFHALKACRLAVMTSPTCSVHLQVSWRQQWNFAVPHTSSVVLRRPVLRLFHISSVAASGPPADALTCNLKTSWKWFLLWGSISFQTFRRGLNLPLGFGATSNLMTHTRSWCRKATSSPGITFTSVTSLHIALGKRMKSICVAAFPDLYVIRWVSRFLKHVFSSSKSNARAYSRILSP